MSNGIRPAQGEGERLFAEHLFPFHLLEYPPWETMGQNTCSVRRERRSF